MNAEEVVGRRGRDWLGLGRVVGSFGGTSLAVFPGLRGSGFRALLLGLAFCVASDPEGVLVLEGAEPGARAGGKDVAGGGAGLVGPGRGAGDRDGTAG